MPFKLTKKNNEPYNCRQVPKSLIKQANALFSFHHTTCCGHPSFTIAHTICSRSRVLASFPFNRTHMLWPSFFYNCTHTDGRPSVLIALTCFGQFYFSIALTCCGRPSCGFHLTCGRVTIGVDLQRSHPACAHTHTYTCARKYTCARTPMFT
jgi:hypothetical protein